VQREDIHRSRLVRRSFDAAQRYLMRATPTLLGQMLAGVVDENAAHELCGDSVELRPVLPFDTPLVDEAHVGFVDQRCGLQRVAVLLAPHRRRRPPMELGVDNRKQLIAGGGVAASPCEQELRNVCGLRI
jgi:hypothetical protein